MIQIIPTILVNTFDEFKNVVKKIENDFTLAQIDVMDGKFVSNTTFYDIKKIHDLRSKLKYELHLMVKDPETYIRKARKYDEVQRILFHYESVKNVSEVIGLIVESGKKAGLVINPETKPEMIEDYLEHLDVLMVMGVHPGRSGAKFLSKTISKVATIRELDSEIAISVDGGVDDTTGSKLVEAGATILSTNSYLYNGNPVRQRERLLKSIKY
jgi:ribulose-phosphate 3-epimerase